MCINLNFWAAHSEDCNSRSKITNYSENLGMPNILYVFPIALKATNKSVSSVRKKEKKKERKMRVEEESHEYFTSLTSIQS